MTPEGAVVRDFWNYLSAEYGSRIVHKGSAAEMKAAAKFLQTIGILDAEEFLNYYATTIGKTIYIPFEIGVENDDWSLWEQISVGAHEHQHIVELNRDGWVKYNAGYALSGTKRALYEAECYRTDMELWFWKTGQIRGPGGFSLKGYGLSAAQNKTYKQYLEMSAQVIRRGAIVNEVSQKSIRWLNQNGLVFQDPRTK